MKQSTASLSGDRPKRYSFALNEHKWNKVSKCPKCNGQTFKRKFPLFIMVEDAPVLVLGLTCKYCAKCEFIIAHQHELEEELCIAFEKIDTTKIGNGYSVMGTVDKKVWQKNLKIGTPFNNEELAITFFEEYLALEYSPAGWFPVKG